MLSEKNNILSRYQLIQNGLKPEVQLVVVTKTRAIDDILPLLKVGHREFAENRVQEALTKWPALKQRYPDIILHLIGPLQTNKITQALSIFDVIQTVDRPNLVEKLPPSLSQSFFIQINTGYEHQKSGVLPENLPQLMELIQKRGLSPTGFMVIPPVNQDPIPHFQLLSELARTYHVSELSMGMSNDYGIAIQCGATLIRVGSAIFGDR